MVVPGRHLPALNAGGPGAAAGASRWPPTSPSPSGWWPCSGAGCPAPLKVFLLTLAIVDDIGAILVIAVFYTDDLVWQWLVAALVVVLAVVACRRAEVRYHVVYVVLGVAMWFFVLESGVHATIAGVVMGLLTPALPYLSAEDTQTVVDELEGRDDLTAADVHRVVDPHLRGGAADRAARAPAPPVDELPDRARLRPGQRRHRDHRATASSNPSRDHRRGDPRPGRRQDRRASACSRGWRCALGVGRLPEGVRFSQLVGVAVLAGIGFTVSLFVSGLAFPGRSRASSCATRRSASSWRRCWRPSPGRRCWR